MSIAPPLVEANEADQSQETIVDQAYEGLVQLEVASIPDPKEKIPSGKIDLTDYEYEVLINHGASKEDILRGNLTREVLLHAGFAFNNYPFAHVEKPLINAVIDGVDYGRRKFITEPELAMIKQYQRVNHDLYGGDFIESDGFRKDMLSLLLCSNVMLPTHIENKVNFLRHSAIKMDFPYESLYETPTVRKNPNLIKINGLYKDLWKAYVASNFLSENPVVDEQAFIDTNLSELMPWEEPLSSFTMYNIAIRGLPARYVESRNKKLNGLPSPFLKSGYHFGHPFNNPDFTIIGRDGRPFRVNFMVLHLLSEGISEMSDKSREDKDQDYSIGHYINNLYSSDSDIQAQYLNLEAQKFDLISHFNEDKLMAAVQNIMKEVAMKWASTQASNRSVRNIVSQINVLQSPRNSGARFKMPSIKSLLNWA